MGLGWWDSGQSWFGIRCQRCFSASKAVSAFGPALGVKVQSSPTATWLIGQVTDDVCTSALGLLGTGTGDVWAILLCLALGRWYWRRLRRCFWHGFRHGGFLGAGDACNVGSALRRDECGHGYSALEPDASSITFGAGLGPPGAGGRKHPAGELTVRRVEVGVAVKARPMPCLWRASVKVISDDRTDFVPGRLSADAAVFVPGRLFAQRYDVFGGGGFGRRFGAGLGPPGDVLTHQDVLRMMPREAYAEAGHDDEGASPHGAAYL
jgi:hypothetical protein